MGTRYLTDYETRVQEYLLLAGLQDAPASLTQGQIDAAIGEAVSEHARYRARVVNDATLDGTGLVSSFRLDTLTIPYEDGFSSLLQVEYPTGNTPVTLLDPNSYRVTRNSSGQAILSFLETTPDAGTNNIRVDYTARHTLTAAASSLVDADFDAVCHLATSYGFLALAGRAAHAVQPTIAASEAGPRTQADIYAMVGKLHRGLYFSHFGISEKDTATIQGASGIRDLDTAGDYGQDWVSHSRIWR